MSFLRSSSPSSESIQRLHARISKLIQHYVTQHGDQWLAVQLAGKSPTGYRQAAAFNPLSHKQGSVQARVQVVAPTGNKYTAAIHNETGEIYLYVGSAQVEPGNVAVLLGDGSLSADRPSLLRSEHIQEFLDGLEGFEQSVTQGHGMDPDSYFNSWTPEWQTLHDSDPASTLDEATPVQDLTPSPAAKVQPPNFEDLAGLLQQMDLIGEAASSAHREDYAHAFMHDRAGSSIALGSQTKNNGHAVTTLSVSLQIDGKQYKITHDHQRGSLLVQREGRMMYDSHVHKSMRPAQMRKLNQALSQMHRNLQAGAFQLDEIKSMPWMRRDLNMQSGPPSGPAGPPGPGLNVSADDHLDDEPAPRQSLKDLMPAPASTTTTSRPDISPPTSVPSVALPERKSQPKIIDPGSRPRPSVVETAVEAAAPTSSEADSSSLLTDHERSRLDAVRDQLDALVGMQDLKGVIEDEIDYLLLCRMRGRSGLPVPPMTRHVIYAGNPGTGKTTVAQMMGEVYAALGVLSHGHVVMARSEDMLGEYRGHTAPKTTEIVERSHGGILFIDEAYMLSDEGKFGKEAIDTLLQHMENDREKFIVIAAGYPEDMERFVKSNPGLKSRFARTVDFPDYTAPDLTEIFMRITAAAGYTVAQSLREELNVIFSEMIEQADGNFANAREARSLFERTTVEQSVRLLRGNRSTPSELPVEQLQLIQLEDIRNAHSHRMRTTRPEQDAAPKLSSGAPPEVHTHLAVEAPHTLDL